MRLHKKVLYIVLAATCMSVWLAVRWSSGDLRQSMYRRSLYLRDGLSQKEEFLPVVEKVSRHAAANNTPVIIHVDVPTKEEPFYKNVHPNKPMHTTLVDDHKDYFIMAGSKRCLIEGTTNSTASDCVCKAGWHGPACSYPDITDEKQFKHLELLKLRDGAPKRIIYGVTFNIEFEMLEIRLREMGDLIDLIVVLESNYTGFGDTKPLYLLEKMKAGFLREYQHKILYLYLNYFPTGPNPKDGSYTDFYMKSLLSKEGLRRINGTRKDDLFIFADADELHRREALLFLKLHDGYPEPFGVVLRRNAFGFFWCSGESLLGIGCSLSMLGDVYKNNCADVRGATSQMHRFVKQLNEYEKEGHNVQMWQFGKSKSLSNIGGWHCSWCFEPARVRLKLLSAFNYDFPRWGNYPEKTKLDYIKDLIKVGLWFDGKSTFKPQYIGVNVPYAPAYVLRNTERFRDLVFNPYRDM